MPGVPYRAPQVPHPGPFCSKTLSISCFSQMACMLVYGACCFAFRAYQEPTRTRSVLCLSMVVQDERICRRSMLYAAVWSHSVSRKCHRGSVFIQKLPSNLLSGSASRNTLQYTLPTDLYPDPTLTNCMACAVQIGICCANRHSTCPAYLNQTNSVTRY